MKARRDPAEFRCQARVPCSVWNPLSPANHEALAFWGHARRLGPELALALADLTFTPDEHAGFVERLLVCAQHWPLLKRS